MTYQNLQPSESKRPSKISIPRIEPPRRPEKPQRAFRGKTAVACTACRERRVRCDGGQPRCRNCLDSKRSCVYLGTRRNRLKTFVCVYKAIRICRLTASSATKQNQDLIALMKQLRASVTDQNKQQIDHLLSSVSWSSTTQSLVL